MLECFILGCSEKPTSIYDENAFVRMFCEPEWEKNNPKVSNVRIEGKDGIAINLSRENDIGRFINQLHLRSQSIRKPISASPDGFCEVTITLSDGNKFSFKVAIWRAENYIKVYDGAPATWYIENFSDIRSLFPSALIQDPHL